MDKKQKQQATKQLKEAQDEAVKAMRQGNQKALDKASDKAVEAFARIANSKR